MLKALDFSNATSNRVDCGSDASISFFGDLTPNGSFWCWAYAFNASANMDLLRRRVDFDQHGVFGFNTTDGFSAFIGRPGGTNYSLISAVANFAAWGTLKWMFIAWVWDTGGAASDQRFYVGDLSNPPAEPSSYTNQQVGSGSIGDESSAGMRLFNNHNANTAWDGYGATPCFEAETLTAAQVYRRWRFCRPGANVKAHWLLGQEGQGLQIDRSIYRNHGTVTGATPALGPPVPYPWVTNRRRGAPLRFCSTETNKRAASFLMPLPFVILPCPDGSIGVLDRRQAGFIYPIEAGAVDNIRLLTLLGVGR